LESVVPDDRAAITTGDKVLLIVENDLTFASILLDAAHEKGFKGVVAVRGDVGWQWPSSCNPTPSRWISSCRHSTDGRYSIA